MIDAKTGRRLDGKKYLVHGGYIKSPTDGQRHYLRAGKVADLYGVDPRLCHFWNLEEEARGTDTRGLIILRPRDDGNYTLPEG